MLELVYVTDNEVLSFDRGSGTFYGEASTIGLLSGKEMPLEIKITAESSGNALVFEYSHVERDPDGDVYCWVFRAATGADRVFILRIGND